MKVNYTVKQTVLIGPESSGETNVELSIVSIAMKANAVSPVDVSKREPVKIKWTYY